jgi:hypothetical protein
MTTSRLVALPFALCFDGRIAKVGGLELFRFGARGGNRRFKVGWEGHTWLDGAGMFARLASIYIIVMSRGSPRSIRRVRMAGVRYIDFSRRRRCLDLE